MLTAIASWLKAVARWLAEAYLLWITLAVVSGVLLVVLRTGVTELEIRATGLVLQWLGIGTVAHGVREARRLFGQPDLIKLFLAWISRFPRWRRQAVVVTGTGTAEAFGHGTRVHAWSTVDLSAPVEVQLQALTENVENLNERLAEVQTGMETDLSRQSEILRQEQRIRAKHDSDLHLRLQAAETGGLHITFMGVIWLFLGVLLATLSPEIYRWRS